MRNQLGPVRAEAGCLAIDACRSTRDPRLFFLHSRWIDEAAFEVHAALAHSALFLERVRPPIDHPLDVTRTTLRDEDGPSLDSTGASGLGSAASTSSNEPTR
jgi:quinol monooxygenase YgiN